MVALLLWIGLSGAGAQELQALCFPSGLRVGVVPRPGAPIVGLGMVVRGGSSAEMLGEEGAAHFLEHLWFRSVRRGGRTVNQILEEHGAEANAYTTQDETIYLTVAHRRALRSLLQLEAQRVLDPLGGIPVEVIGRERDVVRNELRERFDYGSPILTSLLSSMVVQSDPYSRPVGGTDQGVQRLTWQIAQAYADRQYDPEKVSLVIAGDVDLDALPKLLQEALPRRMLADPRLPRDNRARRCPDVPPDEVERPALAPRVVMAEARAHVDEPMAIAAWPAGTGHDDAETARLASMLMEIEMRERDVETSCDVLSLRRLNVLTCHFPLGGVKNADQHLRGALKPVRKLWRQLSSPDDGRFAMYQHLAKLAYRFRLRNRTTEQTRLDVSPSGHLSNLSTEFHWWHRSMPPVKVEAEAVGAFGSDRQDSLRTIVIRPIESSAFAGATIHGQRGRAAPQANGVVEPQPQLDLDGLSRLVVAPPLDQLRIERLPSGMWVWALPFEGAPRSRLSLVFPGQASWTDPATRHAAAMWLADPDEALSKRERARLWRTETELSWGKYPEFWSLDAVSPAFGEARDALRAVMPPPVSFVRRKEVRQSIEEMAEWRQEARLRPAMVGEVLRWNALAEGLPHPVLSEEGFAAMAAVSRRQARKFAQATLDPERSTLIAVVGEDLGLALKTLRSSFSGLRSRHPGKGVPEEAMRTAAPRAVMLIGDKRSSQAVVGMACHLDDQKSMATWLIESLLQKRLNEVLRNELGATYGVRAQRYWEAHGPSLEVHTRVPPALAGEAVKALFSGIEALSSGDIGLSALDDLKREVAMRSVTRWQTSRDVLGLLRQAAIARADPRGYDLAKALYDVSVEDLAASLAPCRGFEAVTVQGDPEAVRASLVDAGLPVVEPVGSTGDPGQ